MIKNVFWDMDGTLIDSSPGICESLKETCIRLGYDEPDYHVLRSCIGPPFSESLIPILKIKEEDVDEFIRIYRKIYDEEGQYKNCIIYKGVEEAVKRLASTGYSLTLASSKNEVACRLIMDYLGLDKYFTSVVGSSMDRRVETKTEVIEECFARSPWQKKDETVLIGDTPFDVIGATNAGIIPIAVTYGFSDVNKLKESGASLIFDTIEDVVKYIESH